MSEQEPLVHPGPVVELAEPAVAAIPTEPTSDEPLPYATTASTPPSELAARLHASGAAGVVLVDIAPLEAVERMYGAGPYEQVVLNVARQAEEIARMMAPGADLIAWEYEGRDRISLVLFRERGDRDFYLDTLPRLARAIEENLPALCRRSLYPYVVAAPRLHVGYAVTLVNPGLQADRQIEKALDDAQRDATLAREFATRTLRNELVEILISERVESVFEKVIDLRSMEISGYEALVRGPAGSELAMPSELFRVAEATGLTFQLDCLCRRSALRGAASKFLPNRKLFLNCLPSAIHDPSFRDEELVRTLTAAGLHPRQIVFEISETEAIKNYPIFKDLRSHFKDLGFQFALDDTGTGYSSLSALMELAPEYIKIDRSLVRTVDRDPSRKVLLRALAELGQQLGAQLIGEGVETRAELQCLSDLGIDYAQGFFFGRGSAL